MIEEIPSEFFIDSRIHVAKSPKGGMGVFAKEPISADVIIEYSPVSACFNKPWKETPYELQHIVFSFPNQTDNYVIALGYVSLYNHDDNDNCIWRTTPGGILMKLIKNVNKSDEIFINYGDTYWSGGWPKL